MSRLEMPAAVDILAGLGLLLIALAVAVRIGPDVALGVVGVAFLLYAILASRSEATP
jgi:hypothetical protein